MLKRLLYVGFLLLFPALLWATSLEYIQGEEDEGPDRGFALVPYAFTNDATDEALAIAAVFNGYGQDQASFVANGFHSSNGSYNLFLLATDIQLPGIERLFIDAVLVDGEWGEIETYTNGNPDFPDEDAGSNDSSENNFIKSEGSDQQYRVELRYLLPIGHGRGEPVHRYVMSADGLLLDGYEQGGDSWNPFASGRSFINLQLYDRAQDLTSEAGVRRQLKTTALNASLLYDNTDFHKNPSRGSKVRLAYQRDWGRHGDDGAPWWTWEAEYSKFFNLGSSGNSLQRVLAFNAWWIDTPSWDDSSSQHGEEVFHRPPPYAGATLGGLERQRGFATARFNDRSAVNYQLEYRHTPGWNPWRDMPVIKLLNIRWWQYVGFAEAGRVHHAWDIGELHRNMKWTAGAGIRLYVQNLVVRADIAGSEEDSQIQMFIGQTF